MTSLVFHHYATLLMEKLSVASLLTLTIGLLGIGLYLVLVTQNKLLKTLGIVLLVFGGGSGLFTLGDQQGGAACRASWDREALQKQVADKDTTIAFLQQKLKDAADLSAFVAQQNEKLEAANADRQKAFDDYRKKQDHDAVACRRSNDDDARIVCYIGGYTAAGCAKYKPAK